MSTIRILLVFLISTQVRADCDFEVDPELARSIRNLNVRYDLERQVAQGKVNIVIGTPLSILSSLIFLKMATGASSSRMSPRKLRNLNQVTGLFATIAAGAYTLAFVSTVEIGASVAIDLFRHGASRRQLLRFDSGDQFREYVRELKNFFDMTLEEQFRIATHNPELRAYLVNLDHWFDSSIRNIGPRVGAFPAEFDVLFRAHRLAK